MPDLALRPMHPTDVSIARRIDDDACARFADVGIRFPDDAGLARAEEAEWAEAAAAGSAWFALDTAGAPFGLLVLGRIDGLPHLIQISVLRASQGARVGARLLEHALAWAADAPLWLTTYAHVPWNGPWYARRGFRPVPYADCGPQMQAVLRAQYATLEQPQQRCAYVHDAAG